MRIVSVKVLASPPPGMLHLHYSAPRGGRSTVGHMVREDVPLTGDPSFVAQELARRINVDRQWAPGCFEAKSSGSDIMIILTPEVSNVDIYTDPECHSLVISEWGS